MNIKDISKKQKRNLIILIGIILCAITFELIYFSMDHSKTTDKVMRKEIKQSHNSLLNSYNLVYDDLKVAEEENPTIVFGSDYQGNSRFSKVDNILTKNSKSIRPNLFVFCGDYQVGDKEYFDRTEYGIIELYHLITNYYSQSIPQMYIQGNHDSNQAYGLVKDGAYETNKYIIYVINNDSFPNNQNMGDDSKSIVNETSKKLEKFLSESVGKKKPIFITTHVPLHYSNRNGGYDNKYALQLFDVINNYGKMLDIVYLFGHNHSGQYDDYIGGSINYFKQGSYLKIGGTGEEKKINFTYMNAGYMRYTNNVVSEKTTNVASLSTITVYDDYLSIQKYTEEGSYYSKPIIVKLKN